MTTLAEVILKVSDIVQPTARGTATGGSTTTLVDTARVEPTAHFAYGTVWFLSGDLSGKTAVPTAYSATTHTFTIPTQTAAVAAGVQYAAAVPHYTRDMLVSAVNAALRDHGRTMQTDATLVGVSEQEEYTLPAGVNSVRRVLLDGEVNYYWRVVAGKLVFDSDAAPEAGAVITLHHYGYHPAVSTDTATISDQVDISLLVWSAVYHAAMQRIGYEGDKARNLADRALSMVMQFSPRRMENTMPRDPKFPNW